MKKSDYNSGGLTDFPSQAPMPHTPADTSVKQPVQTTDWNTGRQTNWATPGQIER